MRKTNNRQAAFGTLLPNCSATEATMYLGNQDDPCIYSLGSLKQNLWSEGTETMAVLHVDVYQAFS